MTEATNTALQTTQQPQAMNTSSAALMMDMNALDRMERFANLMASAKSTVPNHFKGNSGDCLAVVMQATTWGMNPYAVAQKTHLINGTLGYEAQLVASVINSSSLLADRFNFEWFGEWEKIVGKFKTVESRTKKDDNGHPKTYIVPDWDTKDEKGLGIRVWATIKGESTPRTLELLMTQARTRNSTLWTEDPKQQLAYLAQKRWARLYAPDVILGVYTPDEIETFTPPVHMGEADVVDTRPEVDAEALLNQAWEKAEQGMTAFAPWYSAHPKSTDGREREIIAPHRQAMIERANAVDAARTVDPAADAAKAQAEPTGEVTYDSVLKRIEDAKNEDALYVAADWINELTDNEATNKLNARFNERLAEIRGT